MYKNKAEIAVKSSIVEICFEIEFRYDINFIEIGLDENNIAIGVQSHSLLKPMG